MMRSFNPTLISLAEPWRNNLEIRGYKSISAKTCRTNGNHNINGKNNVTILVHNTIKYEISKKRENYLSITTSSFPFNNHTLVIACYLNPVRDEINKARNEENVDTML